MNQGMDRVCLLNAGMYKNTCIIQYAASMTFSLSGTRPETYAGGICCCHALALQPVAQQCPTVLVHCKAPGAVGSYTRSVSSGKASCCAIQAVMGSIVLLYLRQRGLFS